MDHELRRCPDCEAPVEFDDDYCPTCGQDLHADPADETLVRASAGADDSGPTLPPADEAADEDFARELDEEQGDDGVTPAAERTVLHVPVEADEGEEPPAQPPPTDPSEAAPDEALADDDDAPDELLDATSDEASQAADPDAPEDQPAPHEVDAWYDDGAPLGPDEFEPEASQPAQDEPTLAHVAVEDTAEEDELAADDDPSWAADLTDHEDVEPTPVPVIVLDPAAFALNIPANNRARPPAAEVPPTAEPEQEAAEGEDIAPPEEEVDTAGAFEEAQAPMAPSAPEPLEATQPRKLPVAPPAAEPPTAVWRGEAAPPRAERLPEPGLISPPARRTFTAPAPPVYAPQYGASQVAAFFHQRVQAYQQGGYRLLHHDSYEALLSYGKTLSVGRWLLAIVSVAGALWYFMLLALSGLRPDRVYITLEADGVYEDGPGAAHIRRQRARTGRRWAAFGALVFTISLLLAVVLGAVAAVVGSQERYQAALREAYPAVTLFEERFSDAEAAPGDVERMRSGFVAFGVVAMLAAVGLWGGAVLFVIGTIHAGAYQVRVRPLPGQG